MNNQQIVRRAYEVAEKKDIKGWVDCLRPTGRLPTIRSASPTAGRTVQPGSAKRSRSMRRHSRTCIASCTGFSASAMSSLWNSPFSKGLLPTPMGVLPPTGKRMDAPCCDVFRLVNGKIQSFDCYPSGTVIFAQLGVLSNIEGAIAHS